jgi:PAS domain S-box-containing protein
MTEQLMAVWARSPRMRVAGLAFLYGLLSYWSRVYFTPSGVSSVLFLPSGVGLAAVLLGGRRFSASIWIGALVSDLLCGDALLLALFFASGAALAAVVGAWVIRQSDDFDMQLLAFRNLLQVGLGGALSAVVSAACGVLTLGLIADLNPGDAPSVFGHWWMGDTLGIILMTPLGLMWRARLNTMERRPPMRFWIESSLVFGLTLISLLAAPWMARSPAGSSALEISGGEIFIFIFVLVIWSSLRLGPRATSLQVLMVVIAGGFGAFPFIGQIGATPSLFQLVNFGMFCSILSLVGLVFAVKNDAINAVTQRLMANDAIRAHEHHSMMLALDQSSVMVVTDLQGRITSMNDRCCEISGYSREELLGQTHQVMSSGLHPPSFFKSMYESIQAGVVWRGEICNRSKQGQLFWSYTMIFPFRGMTGEIEKYVAMRTDITLKKSNEDELQTYREQLEVVLAGKKAELQKSVAEAQAAQREFERYKYVFDQHACVIVSDLDGCVTYCNDRFTQVSGYSREEFVGENFRLLNKGLPQLSMVNQMLRAIDRGEVWHSEVCHRAKDGHLFWVDATVAAFFDEAGKVRRYIAAWTDITDRIRAMEDAELANRAKSNFLSTMSHELRTPMNGVVGMVDVLQQTPLTASQQGMIKTIHRSSLTLLKIVNDILDFSKIEANQLDLERIPVCLADVLRDVTLLMAGLASSKHIKVTTYIDPALPAWLWSDPTRLSQILFNLIGNALKFIDRPDGAVAIQLHRVARVEGSPGLQISVKDNGIGMSQSEHVKLFQPFVQVDASIARKFGGTGLGLSITQKLVLLMQGSISVQSSLGEGSEFTVLLPMEEASVAQQQAPALRSFDEPAAMPRLPLTAPSVEDAVSRQRLILLAEDNEVNREVLQAQLGLLGFACEVAVDGVDALALWRSGRFSLLLTDCNMPNMDGFELTGEIRHLEVAGTHFPIVAITANAMLGEAQRCRDRGMDDYLSKPVRLVELDAMLKLWLPDEQGTPALKLSQPVTDAVAQPDVRIWDIEVLGDVVGDNPALQRRLLSRFLVTAKDQLAAMQHDVESAACQALGDKAHALKSAARSVGALVLGELCEAIETAGHAGDAAICLRLAAQLPRSLAEVAACIEPHLAQADSPS